ncbi:hypothetical protein COU60_01310 [Candidatus Pacearchaeota archaeon CG10_big_fil_rev_8_21_14_0_10_34_76]|nr:MAG: hypothetical protein COU60_01310 [Candidatus Pacearchaeota archaeon CG10_big_fil_rev_8_21_14_0_10_34_76]
MNLILQELIDKMAEQLIEIKDWVEIALDFVGTTSSRYLGAEESNVPGFFDCSGFIQYSFLASGFPLPRVPGTDRTIRHSAEFFDLFGIHIHDEAARRGDLVFSSRNGVFPTHIGLYLGNGEVVHSPGFDNTEICVMPLESIFGKPVRYDPDKGDQIYFRNPIGFKRPAIRIDNASRYCHVPDMKSLRN